MSWVYWEPKSRTRTVCIRVAYSLIRLFAGRWSLVAVRCWRVAVRWSLLVTLTFDDRGCSEVWASQWVPAIEHSYGDPESRVRLRRCGQRGGILQDGAVRAALPKKP